jgi:beta-glucosidase
MLAFYDINMNYCVEPGDFSLMVGSSSADIDLKSVNLNVNNRIKIED